MTLMIRSYGSYVNLSHTKFSTNDKQSRFRYNLQVLAEVALACASKEWSAMNYYVYIIKSGVKNWNYVGFSQDIQLRLDEHNKGNVRSTKPYRPFNLIFIQIVFNRLEARKLEKYLKIRYNKECILDLIYNS